MANRRRFKRPRTKTAADYRLMARERQVAHAFVVACRQDERDCTAHYLRAGGLAWRFVGFRAQDGVTRKDAVQFLRGRLQAMGLAISDLSSLIKAYLLSSICPAVGGVQVSVLKALLPLCNAKGEAPEFMPGTSLPGTNKLVARIHDEHLNAAQVRSEVSALRGKWDSAARAAQEKVVTYLKHVDDVCLTAALQSDPELRRRFSRLLDGLAGKTARRPGKQDETCSVKD